MMIAHVLIYLINCQNKEEKYIAFLMENYHQNLNRNIFCLKNFFMQLSNKLIG